MSSPYLKSILLFVSISVVLICLITINASAFALDSAISLPAFVIPAVSVILAIAISARFCLLIIENEKIKKDFVTIVTHKFRTPITGLKWAIDNLKDVTLSQQERANILKLMDESTTRLLEIVDMLVGSSKFDRRIGYMYEIASMREMIENSMQKYAQRIQAKHMIFKVDPGTTIPNIIIDKRKMQFAFDVVLDNAITYTPPNGMVTISFSQKNEFVIVTISDTGIGFNLWEKYRIFKSFFRSPDAQKMDTEGMGLGLYTAKSIIETHGGKISATSAGKNKGATFSISLRKER